MEGTPAFIPDPNPSEADTPFYNAVHRQFISPDTQNAQVFRRDGLWEFSWTWTALEEDLALPVLVALNKFYNAGTSFTTYDIARPTSRGVATTANMNGLVVNLADQVGRSITVSGGAPCASKLLFKVGDYIGFRDTLQMLTVSANCTADVSGNATIHVAEYIRESPDLNEPIVTAYVPVRVIIMEPVKPTVSDAPPHYTFTARFMESLA